MGLLRRGQWVRRWAGAAVLSLAGACWLPAATLRVGPKERFKAPCAAVAAAAPGDTILIDPAGTYRGDVCAISRANLTLKSADPGRRPVISARAADGTVRYAWSKGIYVLNADRITIDGLELRDAAAPDGNGAAIRADAWSYTVRNCVIHDNQNGILSGVGGRDTPRVVLERNEFHNNGLGEPDRTHNVYITAAAELVFTDNYSHDVQGGGHLLKSRARRNRVQGNRFFGRQGASSYEASFPDGGAVLFTNNIVEQGARSVNGAMFDYGSEKKHPGEVVIEHNTFVNHRAATANNTFLQFLHGTAPQSVKRNLFAGPGGLRHTEDPSNQAGPVDSFGFTADAAYDYRLTSASPLYRRAGFELPWR